ncbi:hypothetical protein KUTeg_014880, partial [Tegillarca granosa]
MNKQQVDSKVIGDKLIYKRSRTVNREKVVLPRAHGVFHTALYFKFSVGDTHAENGNHIISTAVPVFSLEEIHRALSGLQTVPSVVSSTHNIVAYGLIEEKRIIHDGNDDDSQYGGGRCVLDAMKEDGINNARVIVS